MSLGGATKSLKQSDGLKRACALLSVAHRRRACLQRREAYAHSFAVAQLFEDLHPPASVPIKWGYHLEVISLNQL